MQLGYEKLMDTYGISINDLPEETRIMIKTITILKKTAQGKMTIGETVSEGAIAKIKAQDKYIINDILDYIEEHDLETEDDENEGKNDKNDEENFEDSDDSNDDSDDDDSEDEEDDDDEDDSDDKDEENNGDMEDSFEIGDRLDAEFQELKNSGISEFSLNDLRVKSPTAYEIIFDIYEEGEQNGIQTNNFKLVETEAGSQKFRLT